MSAFPFMASSMPSAEPTVRAAICAPECVAKKRWPIASIIGAIVLEPVMRSLPDAGTGPFAGSLSAAWTLEQSRHVDNKNAKIESSFQAVNMISSASRGIANNVRGQESCLEDLARHRFAE